jgi:hypothetical protein
MREIEREVRVRVRVRVDVTSLRPPLLNLLGLK